MKNKNYINLQTPLSKLKSYAKHPLSFILFILIILGACITIFSVLAVLIYTMVQGIPNLSLELFSPRYTSENLSMLPAIINTLFIAVIALIIAVPIGVFSAVFMVEYSKSNNVFVKIVRMAAETLSGIPSIVYGIFGMLCFVQLLGWGASVLSGALTTSLMILPLVMRTTEESLKSIPQAYKEGSYALGASKLRTLFKIILPSAISGIISGIILGFGRIIGETAALIYTAGTSTNIAGGFLQGGETLAVHVYILATNGLYEKQAWACAVILIAIVLVVNGLAELVGNKFKRRTNE